MIMIYDIIKMISIRYEKYIKVIFQNVIKCQCFVLDGSIKKSSYPFISTIIKNTQKVRNHNIVL